MKRTLTLLLTTIYFLTVPMQAKAADNGAVAQDIHGQLAYSNEATVYVDSNTDSAEIISQAVAIDEEHTPYDAEMLIYRAPHFTYTKYNTGKLELRLEGAYDIKDAENLLDIMEVEIRSNRASDSQKDTLNAIIRYINDTYEYDNETYEAKKTDKNILYTNFVDAYYGDRKIVCGQYSTLTVLLCDRFDIDCKIIPGYKHLYNLIKLDGETSYTVYDLTKAEYHLPAKVDFVDLLTLNYFNLPSKNKVVSIVNKDIRDRYTYHYSFTAESIVVLSIIVIIIGIAIKRNTYKRPVKHSKRNNVAKRRIPATTK